MTHITELFPWPDLQDAINDKLVSEGRHPVDPSLRILNYTPVAQYTRTWTPVTTACRGLIYDWNTGRIVARPFAKFFNLSELSRSDVRLSKRFYLREKMDGSLGVAFKDVDGKTSVATRGSFVSDQAQWATIWLRSHHPDWTSPDGITTLFEIIYPENRIVVDYGERAELVLIGAIVNDTGEDVPMENIDWWPGEVARSFGAVDKAKHAEEILQDARLDGHEGLVASYLKAGEPAFRVKLKREEYVELHRIVFGLSSHTLWERLRAGQEDPLEGLPEEMHEWAQDWVDRLREDFAAKYAAATEGYATLVASLGEPDEDEHEYRKRFATRAKEDLWPGLHFQQLDGKDITDSVWKMIEPEKERLR